MTSLVVAAAIFTFQNNFWVNLHQFLHAEASRKAAGRTTQLNAELVEGYAEMAKRDLLRDERLVAINDALSQVEGDTLPATIDPAVAAALTRAAPAYRARFWPQHRQTNDAWISAMTPLVDRFGPALTAALAKAYHTTWPDAPILVDVAIEAGPFGGTPPTSRQASTPRTPRFRRSGRAAQATWVWRRFSTKRRTRWTEPSCE